MKKLIVSILAVVTIITGTLAVSAECIHCANTYCPKQNGCTNECIYHTPYCDGMGMQSRMGSKNHHNKHRCEYNQYCTYR